MRTLALDYGRKRIGLAISDPLGYSAQPLDFILNDASFLSKLRNLIEERQITTLVLGHPLTLKGTKSQMTQEVEAFAETIRAGVPVPLVLWDERLTTAQSERILIEADVRRDKRKQVRDSLSAVLILRGYLQSKGAT